MPSSGEGIESFSASARSASARILLSAGQSNPSKSPIPPATRACSALTKTVSSSKKQKTIEKPVATGFKTGTRDEQEALRYDTLLDYSTRLGGSDLYAFRDNIASKRGWRMRMST